MTAIFLATAMRCPAAHCASNRHKPRSGSRQRVARSPIARILDPNRIARGQQRVGAKTQSVLGPSDDDHTIRVAANASVDSEEVRDLLP